VREYYQLFGPIDSYISGYGDDFFLPGLASLWEYQGGYRWNTLTGEPGDQWDDDWLVIADQGADPFIFSRESGVIWYAVHGIGEWKPVKFAPDLETMTNMLVTLAYFMQRTGDDCLDETYAWKPEYVAKAGQELAGVMQASDESNKILPILGWADEQ
jgi:hypothetical protein